MIETRSIERLRLNRKIAERQLLMTETLTSRRIMSILTLLALVSIGAYAQSDSAARSPAPAAAAADKRAAEKPAQGAQATRSDSSYVIGANDVLAIIVCIEPVI